MTHHYTSTERDMTAAQEKILGKFCTRCRNHRAADGGQLLKAGSGRTRWVCQACLAILKERRDGR